MGEGAIAWPQVKDMLNERLAESTRAQELQREADNQRILDLEKYLLSRIEANKELVEQYHSQHELALKKENEERERAALVLREQLQQRIESGDVQLREHVNHQKESVASAFAASEKAISKAESADEKRFESVNVFREQFRDQLSDQASHFMPREVAESQAIEIRERVERSDMDSAARDELLRSQIATLQRNQAATKATIATVGAAVTFFLTAVVILVNFVLK
jgi:hypothetical protein